MKAVTLTQPVVKGEVISGKGLLKDPSVLLVLYHLSVMECWFELTAPFPI